MGFSGWDPAHQFGWTNLHLSRDMAAISAAHKQYSWSTLYDDLPRDGTIFAAKTESTPQPGYKWALAKLANDTLLPGLAQVTPFAREREHGLIIDASQRRSIE